MPLAPPPLVISTAAHKAAKQRVSVISSAVVVRHPTNSLFGLVVMFSHRDAIAALEMDSRGLLIY